MSVYIYGRNPVKAALLSGKRPVYKLLMQKGSQGTVVEEIREMASRIQLPVEVMEKRFLQKITGDRAKHQGVILFCEPYQPVDWKTIRNRVLEKKNGIVVFIDSVEDPRNLGAIIRTASVLGVDGVILSKAHSAPLDSEVMKTAAGEMEKLDIAQVNNFSVVLNDFS
ncbi:MAG: RNA methyltransferase, partial [Atribacterota bacterium]